MRISDRDRRPFRRHLSVLPTGEYVEQRGVIATAIALAALAASATAGGAIASSAISSHAAGSAADKQVAAETNAATIAKQTADADRAFKQRQAEIDWQNSQQTQHANYDQWAAREGRLSSLGGMLGLGPRDIPAFSPGIDPHFDTTTPGTPAGPGQPGGTPGAPFPAGMNPAGGPGAASGADPVMDALTKNYQALGVQPTGPGSGPTDIAYMAAHINQTGGLTPDNVKYWFGPQGRIAQELAKTKSGASPTSAKAPLSMATMAYGTPAAPMLTQPLQMPTSPYRPQQPFSFANLAGA